MRRSNPKEFLSSRVHAALKVLAPPRSLIGGDVCGYRFIAHAIASRKKKVEFSCIASNGGGVMSLSHLLPLDDGLLDFGDHGEFEPLGLLGTSRRASPLYSSSCSAATST